MKVQTIERLLTEVRDRLADGRISKDMFNMCEGMNGCGTSGCIGGWMLFIENNGRAPITPVAEMTEICYGGREDEMKRERRDALYDLFFRFPEKAQYINDDYRSNITPERAVKAINNWLEGKPGNPWEN